MKKLKYLIPLMVIIWQLALPIKMTIAQDITPFTMPTEPKALVTYYAKKYKVSESKMKKVINCESGWNTMAHNPKGENSWGLSQINLSAHKNITVEQATDPKFAIRFMAYHLSKGHDSMWFNCTRGL